MPAARRSSSSHRPDPEGDDAPSVVYYGGSRSSYGDSFSRYGGFHGRYGSRPSVAYGGPSRPPRGIPPYVLQHRAHVNLPPPPSRVPNAAASVASSLVESVAPLGSWQHSDAPPPSASSVKMSFVGGQGSPPPDVVGGDIHGVFPSGGSSLSTQSAVIPGTSVLVPPPAAVLRVPVPVPLIVPASARATPAPVPLPPSLARFFLGLSFSKLTR